jgi:hypothetical protein
MGIFGLFVVGALFAASPAAALDIESAGRAHTLAQARAACGKAGAPTSLLSASEYFPVIAQDDFARAREAEIVMKRRGRAGSIYPIWTEEGLVTMADGQGEDMSRVDADSLKEDIANAEAAMERDAAKAVAPEDQARLAEGRANVESLKKALEKGFPVYCLPRAGS